MTVITLRSGAAHLRLAPETGGSIAGYWQEHGGQRIDWLRPTPDAALAHRMPLDFASFPLVPYSGRIRDGRFSFGGRSFVVPLNFLPERHAIHGHGWLMPWRVTAEDAASATLEYAHAADDWPWAYHATQRFVLTERRLTLEMTLTNDGPEPMPAGLGPHPYFRRTPQARVTAGIGKVWLNDREVMPTELVDPPAERDLRRGVRVDAVAMDNCFTGWDHRAVIEWPEWRARLTMTAPSPLDFLVVYTPPGQDFFCVEPVSHSPDAVNFIAAGRTDTGLAVLPPGKTLQASVVFDTEVF
jgi:aldose 1-epimerase